MFYKREVFLSQLEETLPMTCVLGKCMVSSFKEYLSCRPTEYTEEDILLCESSYIETEKQVKKLEGLKRFSYSAKVVEDEIYYFRKLYEPQKEASPFLDKKIDELEPKLVDIEDGYDDMEDMDEKIDELKLADMEDGDDDMEDKDEKIDELEPKLVDMEYAEGDMEVKDKDDDVPVTPSMPQMQSPLSSDIDIMPYTPSQASPNVMGLSKKEGARRKMNTNGYILFSGEMLAFIKDRHPDLSFGELSRLLSTEWRNLEASKKAEYEGVELMTKIRQCSFVGMNYKKCENNCLKYFRMCRKTFGTARTREATPGASFSLSRSPCGGTDGGSAFA
uniref:HMG box domain-containing protein n=1 Tax=Oryzias latipes TaxID=8090 RepID=A0A3B3HAI6_ORYLA